MHQPPQSPGSNTPSQPAESSPNALQARPAGSLDALQARPVGSLDALQARPSGSLDALHARIIACERCPRLRAWCTEVARTRRRAYRDETYWGRPVPGFGDPAARVLILGLAPGAHGSNRTGRPFTGDGSGNFLYPVLHEVGFASQPAARNREDGMQLRDLWITSVGRCAPPDNKPTPAELSNCAAWLDEEIALLTRLRVVVCLGHIAWNGYLQHLRRKGHAVRLADYPFRHSAEYEMPDGVTLLGSYHPSLQNTNTGRLTREMFLDIFARARLLASRKLATRPRSKANKVTA